MTSRRRFARALRALLPLVLASSLVGCGDFKRFAYEGFGRRDGWQQADRVIATLEIDERDRIADLGSGGGYFTFRLADAVGPQGHVYAVEVDEEMNEHVAERARKEGYENVETILAAFDDPRLPEEGVDWIFTCNTYHHLEERSDYFRNARRYLRAGGRVAVIDYKSGSWLRGDHFTPSDVIRSEMEAAGYRLVHEHDFLDRQSFLVFGRDAQ